MDTGLILRLSVLLGLVALASAQLAVQHTCSALGDGTFRIDLLKTGDDSYVRVAAIDTDASIGSCISETDGGDESITVLLDANRDQTSPADTCFVQKLADSNQVSFRVAVVKVAESATLTDAFYEVICDFSVNSGEQVLTNEISANALLTVNNAERTFGVVASLLVDDTAVADSAVVNADTSLAIQLDYNFPTGHPMIGVSFIALTISPNSDFTAPTVEPIVASCRNAAVTSTNPFYIEDTFMTATHTAGSTTFVTKSGVFQPAWFIGSSSRTIYLKVEFGSFCDDQTEDICFDQPTHCAARRKRRSTTNPSVNGTQVFKVEVSVNGGTTSNLEGTGQKDSEVSTKECSAMYNFWIVALVLGILLLSVLVFAVFLFYKLKKEQNKVEKVVEKYGVQNPSF